MELMDYIRMIRKRLVWIISFVALTTVTAVWVSYFVLPPIYEASVKVIVGSSEKQNYDAVSAGLLLNNTYKELMKSPTVLNQIVVKHPELDVDIEKLEKKLKVSSAKDSQMITISLEDNSYDKANQIVHAVAESFESQALQIMKVEEVMILPDIKVNREIKPTSKRMINVLLAFTVAVILSTGWAVGVEISDRTVRYADVLEKELGLKKLGEISKIEKKDFKRVQAQTKLRQVGEASYGHLS
ncbi:YveK family protein [Paenibacillus sp. J2TS4]|uniref:YveK family protein n=1 Tax=Paenibacillus sp. J2TS4 TaxID=2807194 RepID=UPI001B2CED1F|nr:Wzz/FepE/Etk N-terminal domain-containing protein [Paenibacillus sp. J2TS4]GIP36195.1 capsular polysaccharide biosynthesis protein [Paenibacillus sp. J2TS4]